MYHTVSGDIRAETAIAVAGSSNNTVETINGDDATLSLNSGNLFIDAAQVTTPDVVCENGVIHIIDAVILPPTLVVPDDIVDTAIAAGFSTLVTALQTADLVSTLQGTGMLNYYIEYMEIKLYEFLIMYI